LLSRPRNTQWKVREHLWCRAINKMGSRSRFFENLRSLTSFPIFPTWEDLMAIFAMVVILDPPWVVLSVLAKS
jgi:hypothetical protein